MGARPDVSVENLMEYAFLAEAYEQARYDRSIPVATLNIGTEDGKGTKLQQEINKLLREIGEKRILDYI